MSDLDFTYDPDPHRQERLPLEVGQVILWPNDQRLVVEDVDEYVPGQAQTVKLRVMEEP